MLLLPAKAGMHPYHDKVPSIKIDKSKWRAKLKGGGQAKGERDLLESCQDGLRRSHMHLTRAARFVPAPGPPVRFQASFGMRSQQLREIRGTVCYVSAVMMDSHDGVISASYMHSRFIPHPGWNDRTSQRMQHHKQTV